MDWTKIPHFEMKEFDDPYYPGSGDKISRSVLSRLVYLRLLTRVPLIVHGPVGGAVDVCGDHGHADNSYHLVKNDCEAVDFHFDCGSDERTQTSWVMSAGFTGLGVYYDWQWGGKPLPVGFHGDVRPRNTSQIWKRNRDGYTYFLA
jgi:hypothetical protein